MRKKPFILLLCLLTVPAISQTTRRYCATTGTDGVYPTRGTIDNPWRTIQYAVTNTPASDTCYFRGGVYEANIDINVPSGRGHNGTLGHPTCFFNYPGETPIIDGNTISTAHNRGIAIREAQYMYFKGFEIRNIRQRNQDDDPYGIVISFSSDVTFENIVIHHIGGRAFDAVDCVGSHYFYNCDAYKCADSLTYSYGAGRLTPGNTANGFTVISVPPNENSLCYFRGCRAWSNSGDGFTGAFGGHVICENCWAWDQGKLESGDGNGFKPGLYITDPNIAWEIKNCISAYNRSCGFSQNDDGYARMNEAFYNCTAYKNTQCGFTTRRWTSFTENQNIIRNCISFDNLLGDSFITTYIHDHNSWDIPITITDADFLSVDSSGISGVRQPDGSLPDINFLKLAGTSHCIDAGTNVGLPYYGSAPDLGYSEHLSGPVAPLYASSVIENVTPSLLAIIYNLTLTNIVPAVSSFSVLVNSVTSDVSSIVVSGTKVLLTLVSPVGYGDVVKISYSKPASNPLQTAAGGQAASISAQNVTNNVGPVIPIYSSSVIENATPSILGVIYNIILTNIVPSSSAFTVSINSVIRAVSSVSISGTKVLLTLASPVVYGDIISVAYTKPASNSLQTAAGGQAASISAQNVTNNVGPVSPVYVSSVIGNATPAKLEMTYNLTLAGIVPDISAFIVTVNSVTRIVNSVSITGTKVLLTLASPVAYGDIVTIAYTKPTSNLLQTAAGGQAASISSQTVTNGVSPPVPVYSSSAVENATPSILEMIYSISLANFVPAASAFTVSVNSVIRSISSVAISGTKVLLTLASPVVYGDLVSVGYTKPVSNPLQTFAGAQAASVTAQNVTNNVAPVSLLYVSSVIENATSDRLEMTYSLSLADIVPAVSAFTVTVNSVVRVVSSVIISGTKILLTLASPVIYGDVVTVSYAKPASNPLQTIAGIQAVSVSAQHVTNLVGAISPIYVNSVIEDATPGRLEMTYSLSLADIVPAVSAFTAKVNSVTRVVNSVVISGTKVLLTLASPVVYGDVVTIAYNKSVVNPLQTTSGGQAVSITSQSVTNNCTPPANQPPVISIFSPSKNSSFTSPATIFIQVYVYDPDGTISKVEFFNGNIKLGEIITDPYSYSYSYFYTWKDVTEGTYTLTATATDNVNAITVSSAVSVTVTNITGVNQPPVVSILSPVNNTAFAVPDTIIFTAIATDADGTISKVEYFNGNIKIGESLAAPYPVPFEFTEAGTYKITALARDNLNSVALSLPVILYADLNNINTDIIINLYPNPNDGHFSIILSSPLPKEKNIVNIINLTGQVIFTGILTNEEYMKQFDLSQLAPGTYILMITSGNEIFTTKKFIKD